MFFCFKLCYILLVPLSQVTWLMIFCMKWDLESLHLLYSVGFLWKDECPECPKSLLNCRFHLHVHFEISCTSWQLHRFVLSQKSVCWCLPPTAFSLPFTFPTLSFNSFCVCLSVFLSLSPHFSVSTIVEEEIEDLVSDSSDDSPKAQAPDVKMSRMFRFPSPENFRQFVEVPVSPPQAERKPIPKYVCYLWLTF